MRKRNITASERVDLPEWAQLMDMHWNFSAVKSVEDAQQWERELRHPSNFGLQNEPDGEDLADAVRYLSGPKCRQSKCPTLRELIIAVRVLRREARHGACMPTDKPEGDRASIEAAMIKLGDHESRWDWLCDHVRDLQTADAIKDWAEDRWPGFVQAVIEYKQDMMRRHGSAWRVVFSGPQQTIEAPRRDVLRVGGAA